MCMFGGLRTLRTQIRRWTRCWFCKLLWTFYVCLSLRLMGRSVTQYPFRHSLGSACVLLRWLLISSLCSFLVYYSYSDLMPIDVVRVPWQ